MPRKTTRSQPTRYDVCTGSPDASIRRSIASTLTDEGFDVPGAACVTAGAMLVVLALVQAPVLGWASPATATPAAVGAVLLGAFLWIEHRSKDPLMPLELLRCPTLWGGMLVTAASMASFGLQFLFLTGSGPGRALWPPASSGAS